MVGAALALALAREDFSVVLVEAREPRLAWDDGVFDLRVSAITRASQNLLANIGAWDAIAADRATAYQAMQVWDRPGIGEIRFDAAELGEPDLGHIVENRVIVRALWRALRGTGVRLLTPAGLRDFTHAGDGATLTLTDGGVIRASVIVGADGAASPVREMAGIPVSSELYDQHALVATVEAANGNGATAW
jgi:2-octaprenylphenol hydroxylase